MKKLTRFILASYFRPFLRSLIISLFLLVLQFLSRYKDDLFGKGLDADVIAKIFGYASVSLIVLALPVSVLLASLFTMGTFGEQYELAAMRSSGLSIRKIISPMVVLTLFVSLVSFTLSSYIIPITNLKLYSLLYDVKQLKPTFSLEPGHFNSDIDNYVIRIEDKDLSKEMLYDIMIYDHTEGRGNDRMVMADSGIMKVDPYGSFMNMWLFDGASFENNYTDKGRTTEKESFVRTHYKALYYSFDLSGFSLERTAESDFASHHYMLNLGDLGFSMDTVLGKRDSMVEEYRGYVEETSKIDSSFLEIPDSTLSIPPDNILLTFPKFKRREVMRRALSSATSMHKAAELTATRFEDKELRYRNYLIEFHGKFSLPVACIIFLFIGAPLGAVVRKGGVGIPILVSVTFYLGFYVIMIQGKKMATEAVVPVWIGVWLPILVLFPLAVLFTYQAASMRKLQFGLVFYAFRTSLQDFLVFILRPVVRLFRGKDAPVLREERHVTILPDDLTLPDQTLGAESELARWERELGISSGEGTGGVATAPEAGVSDSSGGEGELPDMRGDEDELARMERELGISLRGDDEKEKEEEKRAEEKKEEQTIESPEGVSEIPVGSMELPDMRGDEDELARMERELGISLRGDDDEKEKLAGKDEEKREEERKEERKEEQTVESSGGVSEISVGSMELPDMRGDEDELARMERELGISLRGDDDGKEREEEKREDEKKEEQTIESSEGVSEIPVGSMELPDMRGDEDELARMERELGISLRGDDDEKEKLAGKEEEKREGEKQTVESSEGVSEISVGSMELPDMRGNEDELARMERELGISLRGDQEETIENIEEVVSEPEVEPEIEVISEPEVESKELSLKSVESLNEADRDEVVDPTAEIIEQEKITSSPESREQKEIAPSPESRVNQELEEEMARWERELGISFSADPGAIDIDVMPGLNLESVGSSQNTPDEGFDLDLDLDIDLDDEGQ